ncbi:MAG: ATP-binding protein [Bacteroidales bacterium]|nr:ATP-binding protein [Bacteroidales bacterium]
MKRSKAIKYNVVQTIILVTKKLERSKLNKDVIEDIKEPLDLLSDYLCINIEETQLFAVIFALQARINIIDLRDIISFLDISYIDSLSLKSGIDSLLEKNLIELEEENGRKCRKTKYGKSSFSIPDDISDQIYANIPLKAKENKSIDIYEFTKTISDLVQKRKYENINTMDLFFMVDTLEEKNKHLAPISKIRSKLNVEDRAILYEMLNDRIAYGAPTSALELTINDIYENARERRLKIRQLVEKANPMFELEFIELTTGNMANDSNLMLTNTALEFFLKEDAELFIYTQKTKSLIANDSIILKELFFDPLLNREIDFLTHSLMPDNFNVLQKRMNNMGLSKGVTAIFYGSPGTGKTETVYQISRLTRRDVFLVDISQTKSMWFGESEKLIKKVFTDYQRACKQCSLKPILLFNEADAILGKRQENSYSNVSQTENAIQNILLEAFEKFQGILIATSNLVGNIDSAFERRFLFKVKFDQPSNEVKSKIWLNKLNWLEKEFAIQLANRFSFSGGEIDNIVRKICMKEVLTGIRPDTSEIMQFCQSEKLVSGNKGNKVGYN